jgi:hypothetical protein
MNKVDKKELLQKMMSNDSIKVTVQEIITKTN